MAATMDEDIIEDGDVIEATNQLSQSAEDKLESGEQLELGEAGMWVYSTCVRVGAVAIQRSDLDHEMVAEGIERAAGYIRGMDENTVAALRTEDGS